MIIGDKMAKLTLHEAIILVLKEKGPRLSTKDIADEINLRELYEKKDKTKVKPEQIFLRCRSPTYRRMFNKVDKEFIEL